MTERLIGKKEEMNGLTQLVLPTLEKHITSDAIFIPYTKEAQQDTTLHQYDRVCAWCPEPNELAGNYAQYVFEFYYMFGKKVSHGMCEVCKEGFEYVATQEYR